MDARENGRTRRVVDSLRNLRKAENISVDSYEAFLFEHRARNRRKRRIKVSIDATPVEDGVEFSATYASSPNSRRQMRSPDIVLMERYIGGKIEYGANISDPDFVPNRVIALALQRKYDATRIITHVPFEIFVSASPLSSADTSRILEMTRQGLKPAKPIKKG